jgi:hypothetical protein
LFLIFSIILLLLLLLRHPVLGALRDAWMVVSNPHLPQIRIREARQNRGEGRAATAAQYLFWCDDST